MNSRHNKYVSVTDWFAPPPSTDKVSTTVNETSVISAGGASFSGGSWGQGGSGGGSSITIIKTNDTTPESNSNVYSALRVHDSFIAKNKNERTSGKLSSDVGFEVGEFVSGASGAIMYIDPETLQTSAEVDRLKVRIKAYFETLEIVNVNSVGGKQIISPAGAITCAKVEVKGPILKEVQSVDEFGNLLYDDNGNPIIETIVVSEDNGIPEDTYRCYFLAEQDGDKVENRWHVGDQAYCQTFNAFDGEQSQVSNTYYWRLVTSVTTNPVEIDGKQWHYIDLSISDCDTDSDVPKEGDVICHRGSRTENDRRNLLEFSAVDTFSPSITLYQGVGVLDEEKGLYPYSLANKDIISYGVNKTSNKAFMNVYGDMYVGDREGNSFIRFDEVGGLTIKGNLSAGTTLGDSDLTLEQRIEAASQAYKEDINAFKDAVIKSFNDVQNQIDGAIETYFLDPVPTLDNEPAVQWNTDEIKASHVGDLYYSAEGNAYRFQYTTITNEDGSISNSYYWNKINDTDIVTALANAKRALDTADSKRKIFVQQPKTNESYEIGDMWANATYIDPITSLVVYEGDLLRAVTIKLQGQAFSIDHWELASKYTDDSAAIAAMEAAKNAQNTADKAQADATAASNRLNSWAADGVISPTEKKGIKEEYARVIADKDHIDEEYDKYFLGTPTNYNNAYTPYITALIELFTSKSETVLIPDNFETILTTYYTERTNALNEISSAAKKVADDALAAADNAMKEAEEALTVASDAKNVAYDMNFAITGSTEYVRDAFADGIINKGERATIQNQVKQIETIQAQVEESYKEVVSNTLLNGSTELENLKTSYTRFVTATNELKTSISDISKLDSVANIDKAVFEGKYNNFNAAYSTYTQWLNACSKYIEYALNSRVDATLESLGTYGYLKDVLDNEKTTITGGVVLTTMLALGYTDENKEYHINAGIDGGAAKNNDIVFWAGGSNIDKFIEPNNSQAADFLIRGDGTGYAAGGNFWWDSSGTIHADPMSFVISELSVGMLLASFQVYYDWNTSTSKYEPYAIAPKIPFTTLQIASDLVLGDSGILHFGDAELGYDATNNAVYLRSKDGNPINFYTTGGISMYGLGNTSVTTIMDAILYDDTTLGINSNGELYVKGSIGGATTLGGLSNVGTWADSVADVDRIMYQQAGSSNWVAKSLSSIGGGGGVSGDYLPLSGGVINSTSEEPLTINSSAAQSRLLIQRYGANRTTVGHHSNFGSWIYDHDSGNSIGISVVDGSPFFNDGLFKTLIHSGNYSSYALPLTGGKISGTNANVLDVDSTNANEVGIRFMMSSVGKGWIGYSLSLGTYLYNNSSASYLSIKDDGSLYYSKGTIWHSGNDGSGSGLDADLLDGLEGNVFMHYAGQWQKCNNSNGRDAFSITYWSEGHTGYNSNWGTSLNFVGAYSWHNSFACRTDGYIDFYQGINTNTMTHIGTLAYTWSNVASATKLQTARTIWGQSFDGTGNVDGKILLTSWDNDGIGLRFQNNTKGVAYISMYAADGNAYLFGQNGNRFLINHNVYGDIFNIVGGNVGVGTTSPEERLHVNGASRMDNIHFKAQFINLNRNGNDGTIYDSARTALEIEAAGVYSIIRTYNVTNQAAIVLHQNGNVGIGTTNPSQKLHVQGAGYFNEFVTVNGNINCTALEISGSIPYIDFHYNQSSADYTARIAEYSGGELTLEAPLVRMSADFFVNGKITTNGVLQMGNYIKLHSNNWTELWVNWGGAEAGGQLMLCGRTITFHCGNVAAYQIGMTLDASSNLLVYGGITMYSDRRKKTILNHVELSLKQIADAPLIEHYYNSDDKRTTHVGSIAQYWASMNDWFCKLDSEGYYTMEIQNAALASAISIARELDRYESKTDKTINKLKKKIALLEEEVEQLRSRL